MQDPRGESGPASDQPGFLGIPRGMRMWAEAGRRFWAGVILGIALDVPHAARGAVRG
jgi:hypothetical protein